MTTAMHRDAELDRHDGEAAATMIDLTDHAASASSLYADTPETLSPSAEELWSPALYDPPAETVFRDPAPSYSVAGSAPMTIDADELARTAAEVAVMVTRHREELAAAMAELTALQRTLRSEVRSVISELDRIAAGVAPERQVDGDSDVARAGDPVGAAPRGRRSIIDRLLRRS